MIIPGFVVEDNKVQKESLKIPQCLKCDQLSCYHCWLNLLEKENPKCPKCKTDLDPIDKKFIEDQKENSVHRPSSAKSSLHEYDQGVSFCKQKLLINILCAETVIHKCAKFHEPKVKQALEVWSDSTERMLSQVPLKYFQDVDETAYLTIGVKQFNNWETQDIKIELLEIQETQNEDATPKATEENEREDDEDQDDEELKLQTLEKRNSHPFVNQSDAPSSDPEKFQKITQ